MPDPLVCGLILGAGGSKRLGRPKQLLPYGDGTLLGHVVETARGSAGVDRVLLLGPSRHGLDPATPLLADPGRGLNDALAAARDAAVAAGVDRLVFISADLPRVTTADIQALIAQPTASVGIAPDRAGTGTNALSIPLPQGARFGLHYGPDSLASHSAEAARLGLTIETIRSDGLALDIDEPRDLDALTRAEIEDSTRR